MTTAKILDLPIGKLGIWKLNEPGEKPEEKYVFSPDEKKEFLLLKSQNRKREYLAVRLLLQKMLNAKTEIIYRDKIPHLQGSSLHITISHSSELATVLISEKKAGIDVENIQRKTEHVSHRYLSESEIENVKKAANPPLNRILYWCAKEAIYKCACRPEIEFKSNLFIHPLNVINEVGKLTGELRNNEQVLIYSGNYFFYENNVVVYCVEQVKFINEKT